MHCFACCMHYHDNAHAYVFCMHQLLELLSYRAIGTDTLEQKLECRPNCTSRLVKVIREISKTMPPKLYMATTSAPVRAVQMTAKALGLELEEINVDLFKKEHLKPEYLKINPQHTVPTLVDDGFVIWDSHAIMAYLVSKYGKDDSLYPKDLKKRAIIDQRLHFDSGICFARLLVAATAMVFSDKQSLTQSDKDSITEAYDFLEAFLEDKEWMAGNSVTIADYALIATISSAYLFIPIDKEKHPRLLAWLRRAETLPAYERNKKGLEMLKNVLKPKLDI